MNICLFSGRLTKDAIGKNTEAGKFVASYSIAVPVGWGSQKKTVFVNCTHWNCEKLMQYLVKGAAVMVRGQYNEREYTSREGEQKRIHEVIVAELEFQRGNEKKEEQNQQAPVPAPKQKGDEYFEDDQAIPF